MLLLVDQQEGLLSRIHEPELTKRNLVALARSARARHPELLTTGLSEPNGPSSVMADNASRRDA